MVKVNEVKENRTVVYVLRRYLLLCAGLAIMAFGVAFSIKASLGTSPISSVPYVVSLFAPLTVGTATIVMHCVFIFLQILILRRNYHPIQLMQLPVAFFFGYYEGGIRRAPCSDCMYHVPCFYGASPGREGRNCCGGTYGGADREAVRESALEVGTGKFMFLNQI